VLQEQVLQEQQAQLAQLVIKEIKDQPVLLEQVPLAPLVRQERQVK
jgi:hypothetical protein